MIIDISSTSVMRQIERWHWSRPHGAIRGLCLLLRSWNPNIPLGEIVLDRIELWLQIWGLPVEYQNAVVAEKLARTAREVIKIDWRHLRPRNIRFLRVRIALDPRKPLASGCTMERSNGTVQWAVFSYENINKLCLSYGFLGHTHPYCSRDAAEVDKMVRQRMRPITERYDHPIVTDPQNNLFSNRMRAFLHRASRITTRVAYGNTRQRQETFPFNNVLKSEYHERGSTSGAGGQVSEDHGNRVCGILQTIHENLGFDNSQVEAQI
ncbi:hypothetical protein COLO4_35506 [Corchorus olitorius]|uniref:Uncharacterized protein n=1 Tax=Corchorus olitorius TaxID=93759 RepID=A0A1R3GG72_9ROSI|nr:hypothetical protein COLO4_35506 [Corchorus olitorius]